MGAIKDLVDLTTQLANSVKDRKFASEVGQIQSMINNILSEHAVIHEQRIELMTENSSLKQTNASLQQDISALQQKVMALKEKNLQPSNSISEEEQNILVFLAKHKDVNSSAISHNIDVDSTKTEYWLQELEEKGMILAMYTMDSPVLYTLDQNGRRVLMTEKLI